MAACWISCTPARWVGVLCSAVRVSLTDGKAVAVLRKGVGLCLCKVCVACFTRLKNLFVLQQPPGKCSTLQLTTPGACCCVYL